MLAVGPIKKNSANQGCQPLAIISGYSFELSNLTVEIKNTFSTGAKEIFPTFPTKKQHDLINMEPLYKNELKPSEAALIYNGFHPQGMLYLKREERALFRLRFGDDGKLYTNEGKLFDTRSAKKIDIEGMEKITGRAIFVMGADGQIYVSNIQEIGHFHHSTFFSGGGVVVGGEIEVHDGVVKLISNNSGHYRPSFKLVQDMESYFKSIWGEKTPKYLTENFKH